MVSLGYEANQKKKCSQELESDCLKISQISNFKKNDDLESLEFLKQFMIAILFDQLNLLRKLD